MAGAPVQDTLRIWEGIYASFDEAAGAVTGPGFSGDVWRTRSVAAARESLDAVASGRPIPSQYTQRSAMLPPVVATMLAARERVRILDFGGGLGIGYLTLLERIPSACDRIDYTIVEVPPIGEEGRRLFAGRIRYAEALPSDGAYDLVYASSSLQYVDDWRLVLQSLGRYGAPLMLLSDLFAGPIPNFVTLQNYYGSRIPHWFINVDDLLSVCEGIGYRAAMKSHVTALRLGVEGRLPMSEFPATHRLDHTLHLLLYRPA